MLVGSSERVLVSGYDSDLEQRKKKTIKRKNNNEKEIIIYIN